MNVRCRARYSLFFFADSSRDGSSVASCSDSLRPKQKTCLAHCGNNKQREHTQVLKQQNLRAGGSGSSVVLCLLPLSYRTARGCSCLLLFLELLDIGKSNGNRLHAAHSEGTTQDKFVSFQQYTTTYLQNRQESLQTITGHDMVFFLAKLTPNDSL